MDKTLKIAWKTVKLMVMTNVSKVVACWIFYFEYTAKILFVQWTLLDDVLQFLLLKKFSKKSFQIDADLMALSTYQISALVKEVSRLHQFENSPQHLKYVLN